MKHPRILLIIAALIAVILLFIFIQLVIIRYNGRSVPVPDIPREEQRFGSGPELRYAILGDSTSIGQGAEYADSYAIASAKYLGGRYDVRMKNFGVSGARAKDVLDTQLTPAIDFKADVVLLAVGANDVTHLTSSSSLRGSLSDIFQKLYNANKDMRVVITGSPDMGSVARFPWPTKQLAGLRMEQVNAVFKPLIKEYGLFFAPIADVTGQAFKNDPTLFAKDKFHPNARGYALWVPVINDALDKALQ